MRKVDLQGFTYVLVLSETHLLPNITKSYKLQIKYYTK